MRLRDDSNGACHQANFDSGRYRGTGIQEIRADCLRQAKNTQRFIFQLRSLGWSQLLDLALVSSDFAILLRKTVRLSNQYLPTITPLGTQRANTEAFTGSDLV